MMIIKSANCRSDKEIIIKPQVKFVNCSIRTSLETLGKKCTFLNIRNIGVCEILIDLTEF